MKKIICIFFLSILIGGESRSQSTPDMVMIKDSIFLFEMGNDVFSLVVDYSKSLDLMIRSVTSTAQAAPLYPAKFSWPPELIGQKVHCTAVLFHFSLNFSGEYAVGEMERAGYRPATLAELLAFGKDKWDGRDLVVALGSVYWSDSQGGRNLVPILDGFMGSRTLEIGDFNGPWKGPWECYYRFLAIRK